MVLKMKQLAFLAPVLSIFLCLRASFGDTSNLTFQKTGKMTFLGSYGGGEKNTSFQGHDYLRNEREEKISGGGFNIKIERQKFDGVYFYSEFSMFSGQNKLKVKDHLRDGLDQNGSDVSIEGDLDRKFYELSLGFGYSFLSFENHLFTPYVGLSGELLRETAKSTILNYEENDTARKRGESNFDEDAIYFGIGLQYQYLYSNNWSYILDASLNKSIYQKRDEFIALYWVPDIKHEITYGKFKVEAIYQTSGNLSVVMGPELRIKNYKNEEIKEKDLRLNMGLSSKF